MAYGYSEVFTGADAVGKNAFDVNPFSKDAEKVYLNGIKLIRIIDYTVSNTDPADPNNFHRITLDLTRYPSGLPDADDVLEVMTDYSTTAVTDPIFSKILDDLNDIKTATMGSWYWDKRTGILTMYDTNGLEKFKFNVDDTSEMASRERRSDLEV